jgi:hypothetical protein
MSCANYVVIQLKNNVISNSFRVCCCCLDCRTCLSVCLLYSLSIDWKTKIILSTKDQCLSEVLIWFLGGRQVHNLSLGTLKNREIQTFGSLNWFKSDCNIDNNNIIYIIRISYNACRWLWDAVVAVHSSDIASPNISKLFNSPQKWRSFSVFEQLAKFWTNSKLALHYKTPCQHQAILFWVGGKWFDTSFISKIYSNYSSRCLILF